MSFPHAATSLIAIVLAAVVVVQQAELRSLRSSPAPDEIRAPKGTRAEAAESARRAVVERVVERLRLMRDVARWKWNEKKPIDDPPREAALLESVLLKAANRGVDVAFARRFFEDQIAAAKLIQRADFEHWKATGQGRFEDVPDLAEIQRPRIDAATDALLEALARLPPAEAPRASSEWSALTDAASREFASPADPVRRALRSLTRLHGDF